MTIEFDQKNIETKFLESVKHHIEGWRIKVETDFSKGNFDKELAALKSDPVYSKFAFDVPEYVMVRLIGRMSISIGRRLGEIYDKLPRYVASARFNIDPEAVAEKFNGLELDIGLRFDLLSQQDRDELANILTPHLDSIEGFSGLGIEIRYNFNPNDSARLRKDVQMCEYLVDEGLIPVYLIYSAISPRDDAISRLTRAGWRFMQGTDASDFTTTLFGIDFLSLLDRDDIKKEIHREIQEMLQSIFDSEAFGSISKI